MTMYCEPFDQSVWKQESRKLFFNAHAVNHDEDGNQGEIEKVFSHKILDHYV